MPSGKWLLPVCLTEHVLWGCWESGIFPETSKVETSLPDPGLQDDVSGQIHSHLISGFVPSASQIGEEPSQDLALPSTVAWEKLHPRV